MKANQKIIQADDHAVSAVIGVILMVAITVAIAATVYVYVSGMIGGGATVSPALGMSQSGSSITISSVTNGPVNTTSCMINIVNKTSGLPQTTSSTPPLVGRFIDGDNNPDIISGGDVITFTTAAPLNYLTSFKSGDQFTVQLAYKGSVIGSCTFTVQ